MIWKKKNLKTGDIVIYSDANGEYQVDVVMQDAKMWLTQYQLETLFQTNRTSIAKHIKNIIKDGELDEKAYKKRNLKEVLFFVKRSKRAKFNLRNVKIKLSASKLFYLGFLKQLLTKTKE